MIIKPPEDMSRKEKERHLLYVSKTNGNDSAYKWWVSEGVGISLISFKEIINNNSKGLL